MKNADETLKKIEEEEKRKADEKLSAINAEGEKELKRLEEVYEARHEKQIEADLFDRIVTNGGNYTVLELVEKYVSLKTGVRHNTVAGYKTVINMLKKEDFGKQRIDKVRLSDAKGWLIKLQQIDGRGYSSIHSIRGVLRPAFQLVDMLSV